MALPTICQQRPRSPSMPRPSLIPFHPPSVHLTQHSPPVPRLVLQALPTFSFCSPPHLSSKSSGIWFFSHRSGVFLFYSSFRSQAQTSWRPARASSRRVRPSQWCPVSGQVCAGCLRRCSHLHAHSGAINKPLSYEPAHATVLSREGGTCRGRYCRCAFPKIGPLLHDFNGAFRSDRPLSSFQTAGSQRKLNLSAYSIPNCRLLLIEPRDPADHTLDLFSFARVSPL